MNAVYLDYSLVIAFFLDNHPAHEQAVTAVAWLLKNRQHYFCSLNAIFEAVRRLTKELYEVKKQQLLADQWQIEREVVNKVYALLKKLQVKIIYATNERIFSHAVSLQTEYKIAWEIAFYTALLQEQKISSIVTFDQGYDVLFAEGVLTKFGT